MFNVCVLHVCANFFHVSSFLHFLFYFNVVEGLFGASKITSHFYNWLLECLLFMWMRQYFKPFATLVCFGHSETVAWVAMDKTKMEKQMDRFGSEWWNIAKRYGYDKIKFRGHA